MEQCADLSDTTTKLVRMAFELAPVEVTLLPQHIARTLEREDVQAAIKKVLEAEAKKIIESQKKAQTQGQGTVDPKVAKEVAESVAKATKTAVVDGLKQQVLDSPEIKKLKEQAEKVLSAFKCSPVGVWVNDKKTILYIVGAVAGLSGLVGLYFSKMGGPIPDLIEGQDIAINMGKLEFKAALTEFKPKDQKAAAMLSLSGKWTAVLAKLELGGKVEGSDAVVTTGGQVVVPLGKALAAIGAAKVDLGALPNSPEARARSIGLRPGETPPPYWSPSKYTLGLGLKFERGELKASLMGQIDTGVPSASLSVSNAFRAGPTSIRLGGSLAVKPEAFSGRGTLVILPSKKLPLSLDLGLGANFTGPRSGVTDFNLGLRLDI